MMGRRDSLLPNHVNPTKTVAEGDRIAVYWPLMHRFYPGTVQGYNHDTKGVTVSYDDGDNEILSLQQEIWEFITDEEKYKIQAQQQQPAEQEQRDAEMPDAEPTTQKKPLARRKKGKKPLKPRKRSIRKSTVKQSSGDTADGSAKVSNVPVKQPVKRPKLDVGGPSTSRTTLDDLADTSAPPPASSREVQKTQPRRKAQSTAKKSSAGVSKSSAGIRKVGRPSNSAAATKKADASLGKGDDDHAKASVRDPKAVTRSSMPVTNASGAAVQSNAPEPDSLQSLIAPSVTAPTVSGKKNAYQQTKHLVAPTSRIGISKRTVPQRKVLPSISTERAVPKQGENSSVFPSPASTLMSSRVKPAVSEPTDAPRASNSSITAGPVRQLARPIISGVPLSHRGGHSIAFITSPQNAVMGTAASADLRNQQDLISTVSQQIEDEGNEVIREVVRPLVASCTSQLNAQMARVSSITDTVSKLTLRVSDIDDRCKILRADVDNMESEVTSRAEMNKLLSHSYAKQMTELQQSQAKMLDAIRNDLRDFLKDEIRGIEEKLMSEFKKKSVEVFSKLFEGAVNSIDEKDVMEDSTSPSKNISSQTGRVRKMMDEREQTAKMHVVFARGDAGKQVTETGGKFRKGKV